MSKNKVATLILVLLGFVTAQPAFAWSKIWQSTDGRIRVLYEIRGGQVVLKFVNSTNSGVAFSTIATVSGCGKSQDYPPYGGRFSTHVNANSENHVFLDTSVGPMNCNHPDVVSVDTDVR